MHFSQFHLSQWWPTAPKDCPPLNIEHLSILLICPFFLIGLTNELTPLCPIHYVNKYRCSPKITHTCSDLGPTMTTQIMYVSAANRPASQLKHTLTSTDIRSAGCTRVYLMIPFCIFVLRHFSAK